MGTRRHWRAEYRKRLLGQLTAQRKAPASVVPHLGSSTRVVPQYRGPGAAGEAAALLCAWDSSAKLCVSRARAPKKLSGTARSFSPPIFLWLYAVTQFGVLAREVRTVFPRALGVVRHDRAAIEWQ